MYVQVSAYMFNCLLVCLYLNDELVVCSSILFFSKTNVDYRYKEQNSTTKMIIQFCKYPRNTMMMFLFTLTSLSLFMDSHSLQLYHTEVLSNKHSIDYLINDKFLKHINREDYANLEISKNKSKKEIIISYSDRQFGYNYNGTYILNIESPTIAKIEYKNQFLQNSMTIKQLESKDKIKIDISLFTSLPIPPYLLRAIIRKKLSYMKS